MQNQKTILVIAGAEAEKTLISGTCARTGYTACFCETEDEALRQILDQDFSLIIIFCADFGSQTESLVHKIRLLQSAGEDGCAPVIGIGDCQNAPEQAQGAGLDEALSAPLKADVLESAIVRWANCSSIHDSAYDFTFPADTQNDEDTVLCEKALDDLRRLFQDRFGDVLREFYAAMDGMIEELRAGIAEHSADKVRYAAHDMKSTARQFGAFKLASIACAIEKTSDMDAEPTAENWTSLTNNARILEEVYRETFEALQLQG